MEKQGKSPTPLEARDRGTDPIVSDNAITVYTTKSEGYDGNPTAVATAFEDALISSAESPGATVGENEGSDNPTTPDDIQRSSGSASTPGLEDVTLNGSGTFGSGESGVVSGSPDSASTPVSAASVESPDTAASVGEGLTESSTPDTPSTPPSSESANSPDSATSQTGNPEDDPNASDPSTDGSTSSSSPTPASKAANQGGGEGPRHSTGRRGVDSRKPEDIAADLLDSRNGGEGRQRVPARERLNSEEKRARLIADVDSMSGKPERYDEVRKNMVDAVNRMHNEISDDNSIEKDQKEDILRFLDRIGLALAYKSKATDEILNLSDDEFEKVCDELDRLDREQSAADEEQAAVDEEQAKIDKRREELNNRRNSIEKDRKALNDSLGIEDSPAKSSRETEDSKEDEPKPYAEAVKKYADLVADRELRGKGGWFTRWVRRVSGSEKRESEELLEAEKAMQEEVLKYALKEGNTRDEAYDILRNALDNDVREYTNSALEEKIGNRNAFSRFTDKLGSWISMDKSKKSKLKAGAAGFLAGGLKGAAVGALSSLLGVTVPVSAALGAGVAVVVNKKLKEGVRVDELKASLNKKDNSGGVLDDESFRRIVTPRDSSDSLSDEDKIKNVADGILKYVNHANNSREEELDKAVDERLRNNRVALLIGRVAGGAAGGALGNIFGNWTHGWFGGDTQAASVPPGSGNNEASDPKIGRQIGGGINELAKADTTDFSQYEYPWDWAVEKFGDNNAIGELERRVEALRQAGHDVEWHGEDTRRWLSVDGGVSDTRSVLELLANSDV